ncbi:MAG: hypothetical protein KAW41_04750 [Candidatus Diapherotrites archaeon]|nr:hypothetical protein [Candidatus Diapherotrites archaeon]
MKKTAILLGLLLVLSGAFAAVDSVQTYRDANFTVLGSVFKDGATVYVMGWDGVKNGSALPSTTEGVVNQANTSISIGFNIFDDGGTAAQSSDNATDGLYLGKFQISSTVWSDPLDTIKLQHGEKAEIEVDIDTSSDAGYANITADYIKPNITSCNVTPSKPTWLGFGQNFNVTLTGEANGSAWYYYNSTNQTMTEVSPGVYSANYTVGWPESHKGTISCYHADTAGNEDNATTAEELWVDTAAPVISNVLPSWYTWTNNNMTNITFNVTDAASGVKNASITDIVVGNYSVTNVGSAYTATTNVALPEGNVSFNITAFDNVGNMIISFHPNHFGVDRGAPTITTYSPVSTTYTNWSVNFTVSANDTFSPTVACTYYVESTDIYGTVRNSTWWDTILTNGSNSTTSVWVNEGWQNATYNCSDEAGNEVRGAFPAFTVDMLAFRTAWMDMNNTYLSNQSCASIDGWVVDDYSSMSNIIIEIGGVAINRTWNGTNFSALFCPDNSTVWPDGVYDVNATVNDTVGNIEEIHFYDVTIDNTPPSFVSYFPTNGTVYNDSVVNFTVTVSEPVSTCSLYVNSTTTGLMRLWAMPTGNNTFNGTTLLPNDVYVAWFNCTDYTGNVNVTPKMTITVNDVTAPRRVTGLAAAAQGTTKIKLGWDMNRALDLVMNYTVYRATKSGGPYTAVTTLNAVTYTDTGLTADKKYYYVVRARDFYGNLGPASAEASAKTKSGTGGTGGTGPTGGWMPIATPDSSDDVPTPTPTPEPVPLPPVEEREEVVEEPVVEPEEEEAPAPAPTPLPPAAPKSPVTGLLFSEGSLMWGLAALMALATIWMMWGVSKRMAKRKWYEK